jgi:hypothetical protein
VVAYIGWFSAWFPLWTSALHLLPPEMKLTPQQRAAEMDYLYHERLGMICEDREPTAQEEKQARAEAESLLNENEDEPE